MAGTKGYVKGFLLQAPGLVAEGGDSRRGTVEELDLIESKIRPKEEKNG